VSVSEYTEQVRNYLREEVNGGGSGTVGVMDAALSPSGFPRSGRAAHLTAAGGRR
jgi:hypothetical protein